MDLLNFIIRNFGPLNMMMERAGMSEMDIYNRSRDIFHYFKLRYDGPRRRSEPDHRLLAVLRSISEARRLTGGGHAG